MPIITVDGGVITDLDKKRVLVREVTDAAAKAYGLPKESFVVLLKENAKENIGVAGQLLSDRVPK
jgi:4-oxalocrotonate tautomerase